jgi:hypothetical protein
MNSARKIGMRTTLFPWLHLDLQDTKRLHEERPHTLLDLTSFSTATSCTSMTGNLSYMSQPVTSFLLFRNKCRVMVGLNDISLRDFQP